MSRGKKPFGNDVEDSDFQRKFQVLKGGGIVFYLMSLASLFKLVARPLSITVAAPHHTRNNGSLTVLPYQSSPSHIYRPNPGFQN